MFQFFMLQRRCACRQPLPHCQHWYLKAFGTQGTLKVGYMLAKNLVGLFSRNVSAWVTLAARQRLDTLPGVWAGPLPMFGRHRGLLHSAR